MIASADARAVVIIEASRVVEIIGCAATGAIVTMVVLGFCCETI